MTKRSTSPATALLFFFSASFTSRSAAALQPLETFLASAHRTNPDARAAAADARQREAEVDVGRARLLPSLSARGALTHNQYEATVTLPGSSPLTITPQNQVDAFFTADIPLVDLAQFARFGSQKAQARIAAAERDVVRRSVAQRAVRAYYTYAATESLLLVSGQSSTLADRNLALVEARVAAGTASVLDRDRAVANVERARQEIADAELSKALAARALETVSGLAPEPLSGELATDLSEEGTLATWLAALDPEMPELRSARASAELSSKGRDAARFSFVPALSAQAQERLTNATGFTGKVASYTVSATLSFRFDFGLAPQLDVARAAEESTIARAEGTRRALEDSVVDAFHRIRAGIAKVKATTAQASATAHAATIASDQYAAGASTQLDVTIAQRDAFAADVSRLQAKLELAQGRANLRLAVGKPITFRGTESTP